MQVAVLDLNQRAGEAVAAEIDGLFLHTNVTEPASVSAALTADGEHHGAARIALTCSGIVPVSQPRDTR